MNIHTLFTLIPFLLSSVSAHFIFGHLLINGTETGAWQYIREVRPYLVTNSSWREFYYTWPQLGRELANTNMTCGRDAFLSANKTHTANVTAGEEIGFRVFRIAKDDGDSFEPGTIFHNGPGQVYAAKVPEKTEIEDWNGVDGDWFKVVSVGAKNDTAWMLGHGYRTYNGKQQLTGETSINFTLPRTTPPGKYLLRVEQIYPSSYGNSTQFFINCAHVNVLGPGDGTPTDFAKFPGTYHAEDPGIQITKDQENLKNLLAYTAPGPKVWRG